MARSGLVLAAVATAGAVLPRVRRELQAPASAGAAEGRARVGVIADIQHADVEDGFNFTKTTRRHFRGALVQVPRATAFWNRQNVDFVAQLGDIIDGLNAPLGKSDEALNSVLAALSQAKCGRFVHLIGNHELYNFTRAELRDKLGTAPAPRHREFYSFEAAPGSGWRVVVLDPYQDALIGWDDCPDRKEQALAFLRANNPNDMLRSGNWTKGLCGTDKCFVPYNGGFGLEQLQWLRGELEASRHRGERVLLLSHVLLHPNAGGGSTMAWDFDAALKVLADFDCVAAVVCGHDHAGGFHRDEHGVLHITVKSPLNLGDRGSAFAVLELTRGAIELRSPALEDTFSAGTLAQAQPTPPPLDDPEDCGCVRLALRPYDAPQTQK